MRRFVPLCALFATVVVVPSPARAAGEIVREYRSISLPEGSVRACVQYTGDLASGRRPAIVEWTAYSVETGYTNQPAGGCSPQFQSLVSRMAPKGYVHIAANPPGMGRSSGTGFAFWSRANGRAGAGLVRWIRGQPWSDGTVGVVGCSGSAMDGLPLLAESGLTPDPGDDPDAAVMGCFAVDAYRGAFYPGGIRHYTNFVNAGRITHDVDVDHLQPLEETLAGQTTWLSRTLNVASGTAAAYSTVTDGPFWQNRSTGDRLRAVTAPVLVLGSWQDFFSGAPEYAMLYRKPSDRVVLYPGWHGSMMSATGPWSFGDRAVAWFDHHLRGESLPYAGEAPVQFWEQDRGYRPGVSFADGARFRGAASWPPPGTSYRRLYARTGPSGTAASLNDGSLSDAAPSGAESGDPYSYPAPAPGSTTDPRGFDQPSRNPRAAEEAGSLTYTTAPLAEALHLAGPVNLSLWAASTGPDTDFVVRLVAIAPDGALTEITNGWLKASHRALDEAKTIRSPSGDVVRAYHTHVDPVAVPPLEPVRYDVELWQTATELPAGSRLRIVVSGQEPVWMQQDVTPSVNTVLHDAAHPTFVTLPVAP